ncbi:hypothetical protein GF402_07555 [Candidatus Fermentibacteria bacterium]|nr:hypothetical protein [Candidatus Fermentibacteria bacterium]
MSDNTSWNLFRGIVILLPFLVSVSSPAAPQVFTEVTEQMGITGQFGLGHSVGWCDLEEDGDLDVAFSNQDGSGFWLYRNDRDVFVDITSSSGLAGVSGSRIIWAELTGDDYTDLALDTGSGQSLYENDGDCSFTDITAGSGITGSVICSADFDNDGNADLLTLTGSGCSVLYNDGTGKFSASQATTGSYWCGVCLDYDLDGDQDIYLGTYGSDPNVLLRNDGSSFQDVTASAGVEWNGGTSGITSGDYNNDGYPDLYLGNTSSPGCKLFENQGDGTFDDVTSAAGVTGHTDTRTPSFVDYNNDGWLDIFVSNHDFYTYSNQMYRNNGDGTFTDVGEPLGLSGEMIGDYFGTAWGDFDLDGDADLFSVGHIDKYNLMRNDMGDTMPAHYAVVELVGTQSNKDAIGARVSADIGSMVLTRFVGAGEGAHDFHSFPVELGLYDRTSIQSLEISWPSGLVETYESVGADRYLTAVEGDSLYTGVTGESGRLPRSRPTLGCAPNPSSGALTIRFGGVEGASARVEIFDLCGRSVDILFDSTLPSNPVSVLWRADEAIRPGIYLVRMDTPHASRIRKLTLLR